jgi:dolichol-phosphate mannosyltransferase
VLLNAVINYVISDRLVFKTQVKHHDQQSESEPLSELYYPEGLGPALVDRANVQEPPFAQSGDVKQLLVSLVIPAHNEEGCIEQTIQSISQLLEAQNIAYEILVVNDNSRDRTEAILQQLSEENSKVRYMALLPCYLTTLT